MSGLWKPGVGVTILGTRLELQNLLREVVMVGVGLASLALTQKADRRANGFSWEPLAEVAKLFAAIFVCIIPVMAMLQAGAAGPFAPLVGLVTRADGSPDDAAYFWLTGLLSSFLDNAPTYLVFFELAGGDPARLLVQIWRDRQIHFSAVIRSHDPWVHYGELLTGTAQRGAAAMFDIFDLDPVTPGMIADIIRARAALPDHLRDFGYHPEIGLYPIPDAAAPAMPRYGDDTLEVAGQEFRINGTPLLDLVREAERAQVTRLQTPADLAIIGSYQPSRERPPAGLLDGAGSAEDGRVLLFDCGCGSDGCWPLTVRVKVTERRVWWYSFNNRHRPWIYDLGPFRFARAAYTQTLTG
jgi:hypothetical protein